MKETFSHGLNIVEPAVCVHSPTVLFDFSNNSEVEKQVIHMCLV